MKTKIFPGWYVVFAAASAAGPYLWWRLLLRRVLFTDPVQLRCGAFFRGLGVLTDGVHLLRGGVFSGSLADRISTRVVVGVGIVLLALGFFLSSLASGSLQLFLVCCRSPGAATSQMTCLSLMAKKILVSQSTSGDVPESGLDVVPAGSRCD
ncbi:hypothetical protein [Serratia plymuthica]|uniref:hypothetical protein n=1 Tax=Serratia plymuthica TaxID=82996 RepID=UPI000787278B|nr:hypothetical protein [Serratia plymuthica]